MNLPKHFTPYLAMLCALTALTLPTGHKITTDTSGLTPTTKPLGYSKPLEQPQIDNAVQLASVAVPAPVAPPVASKPMPAPVVAPSAGYSGSGDQYLDWIIAHESGGNPYAMNSIGACGLGQSLPCSKVLSVCGSLANVSCQVDWVRSYCIASYGSTYNAWLFWQSHSWY